MSSTFVADTTDESSSAGNTVIIIVNDDTGNISVDQDSLHLLSSPETTTLSVVRVNDTSEEGDVNMTVEEIFNPGAGGILKEEEEEEEQMEVVPTQINGNPKVQSLEGAIPLLALDQEEIEKIEHALQAEQAGQFFNNILPQEAGLDDLLDPELTGEPDDAETVASISLDHSYSAGPVQNRQADSAMSSEIDSSDSAGNRGGGSGSGSARQSSPKRRSQRQIDRQEMEQLKKIRAENEELLKKEKEEMNLIQQVAAVAAVAIPAKPEADVEPPPVAPPAPAIPDSTEKAVPSIQPISRLAAIRQELQQKILSVDPPVKTNKIQNSSKIKSPTVAVTSVAPVTTTATTPTPQSPAKTPVSRVSSSGGVARPRRENRQPPKHLREAFNQLEFEGIEKLVKKTSIKGLNSPEPSTTKHVDEVVENDVKTKTPIGQSPAAISPSKKSPSKNDENGDKNRTKEEEREEEDEEDEEDDEEIDEDGSEEFDSDEDEDDPERLWCVCREPHNNRFMICCDKCEDWFHGKCVGVTRAMGRQLEIKGLEWICPKCVRLEFASTQEPFVHLHDVGATEKKEEESKPQSEIAKPIPSSPTKEKSKTGAKMAKTTPTAKSARVRVDSTGSGGGGTDEPVPVPRRCVVTGCKNDARPNSVYCSDSCIVTHARDSLIAMSKEKTKLLAQQQLADQAATSPATPPSSGGAASAPKWKESVEFGQLMSQPTPPLSSKSKAAAALAAGNSKNKLERPSNLSDDTPVPVMERKTGKILTGGSAPKVASLEQWLKDNPTYEIIKPTSLPRPNNHPRPRLPSSATPTTPTSSSPSPLAGRNKTPTSGAAAAAAGESKQRTASFGARKKSMETAKEEETAAKKVVVDPETTRQSAKTSLKDALWNRCKNAELEQVEEAEVERVAEAVEEALYRLFNKDVGMKYKAKYRSLIFNIKDPKNLGLFRKIVEQQITPDQLVKMTGDEMASKELAEWREREAKHQLDIIQKTELEMMSMSNKYLVKTHKGEEIIEEAAGKALDESESATSSAGGAILPEPSLLESLQDTTSKHKSHHFDLNCQICSGKIKEEDLLDSKDKEKDKGSNSGGSSSSKTRRSSDPSSKSSKTTASSGKSSAESSSRRSSRSQRSSTDHSKDRRDKKKDHHDKERSRSRRSRSKEDKDRHRRHHKSDREKDRSRDKERSSSNSSSKKKKEDEEIPVKKDKDGVPVAVPVVSEGKDKEQGERKEEPVSQAADLPPAISTSNESEASPVNDKTTDRPEDKKDRMAEEEEPVTKQEPTSTVSIKTPEQQSSPPDANPVTWKGVINSPELGKINVQAFDISGMMDFAELELPTSLDVVGRIKPKMVWDYVDQTRRVGTREIVVFKFEPASDADRKHYSSFLSRMCQSERFTVIGAVSKLIKDFYVVPLPKDSPIPSQLASLSQSVKALDENRTSSLLLGVVVRTGTRRKREGDSGSAAVGKSAKLAKTAKSTSSPGTTASNSPSLSYIPTSRSNHSKQHHKSNHHHHHHKNNDGQQLAGRQTSVESTTSASKNAADDAPYSPGQLLDEDPIPVVVDEVLLKHQAMLEDLNRQIEAEKQELASLASTEVAAAAAAAEVMIPGLGEPVIPGLGEPSTATGSSWSGGVGGGGSGAIETATKFTPSTDPPFDHSTTVKPPTSDNPLDLNLTNLQEIISTIQKKEMELKMTSKAMESAPPEPLFSPHDVDMRLAAPPVVVPVVGPVGVVPVQQQQQQQPIIATDAKKKPSLLNQLTDEELVAKAMEMEMEEAGIVSAPVVPAVMPPAILPPGVGGGGGPPPPFYPGLPPPHPGYGPPPMGMPPMMGHPRPFHSPPFMESRPPYHSPPAGPGAGHFRPRHHKKKR